MNNSTKAIALFAVVGCLLAALPAQAQNNGCQPIRLLLQANLDFARPYPGTGWSGIVRGFLNNTEPLNGKLYYLPPPPGSETKPAGQSGHEQSNRAVFDFGEKGMFVTVADGAVFQLSPTVSPHMDYPPDLAFGHYSATVKVAPDPLLVKSGRFVNATGNLSIAGLFLVDGPPPFDMGIWNAEINGRLCKVTPKQ